MYQNGLITVVDDQITYKNKDYQIICTTKRDDVKNMFINNNTSIFQQSIRTSNIGEKRPLCFFYKTGTYMIYIIQLVLPDTKIITIKYITDQIIKQAFNPKLSSACNKIISANHMGDYRFINHNHDDYYLQDGDVIINVKDTQYYCNRGEYYKALANNRDDFIIPKKTIVLKDSIIERGDLSHIKLIHNF